MADKFSAGDRVRIKTDNPGDVKRVPTYIKGKSGWVQRVHGRIMNPRDHRDERPTLYSIAFSSAELFPEASKQDTVFVDVFEDWMIRG
jgi:nitrile hydratase subunit beta